MDRRSVLGKKTIAFVGDFFVAGAGIENVQDRLPELVERELRSNWQAVVIADQGWDTKRELEALQKFQRPLAAVVLSFYYNDINDSLPFCSRKEDFSIAHEPERRVTYARRTSEGAFNCPRKKRSRSYSLLNSTINI